MDLILDLDDSSSSSAAPEPSTPPVVPNQVVLGLLDQLQIRYQTRLQARLKLERAKSPQPPEVLAVATNKVAELKQPAQGVLIPGGRKKRRAIWGRLKRLVQAVEALPAGPLKQQLISDLTRFAHTLNDDQRSDGSNT